MVIRSADDCREPDLALQCSTQLYHMRLCATDLTFGDDEHDMCWWGHLGSVDVGLNGILLMRSQGMGLGSVPRMAWADMLVDSD